MTAEEVASSEVERLLAAAEPDFGRYEILKDLVDECIDLSLDYRQSGHPGGSRSKVHMLLAVSYTHLTLPTILLV